MDYLVVEYFSVGKVMRMPEFDKIELTNLFGKIQGLIKHIFHSIRFSCAFLCGNLHAIFKLWPRPVVSRLRYFQFILNVVLICK